MGDADKPRAPETHLVEATLAGESNLHAAERHVGQRPVEIRGDRWVQLGYGFPGRPPTLDPALVPRWQAELEERRPTIRADVEGQHPIYSRANRGAGAV
jgi:hypothetical protein